MDILLWRARHLRIREGMEVLTAAYGSRKRRVVAHGCSLRLIS